MRSLGMTLIAHAGPEHTIPTNEDNKSWVDWGNPLRFRRALQLGVNVILAHCGHRDKIPDLDDPSQPLVRGFDLFLRLAYEVHLKNQTGEWTGKLLDPAKVKPLKEIRNWNPLLANYVFARNLALEHQGYLIRFPEATFSGELLESALSY